MGSSVKVIWRSVKNDPPEKEGYYIVYSESEKFYKHMLKTSDNHYIACYENQDGYWVWNYYPININDFWAEIPNKPL